MPRTKIAVPARPAGFVPRAELRDQLADRVAAFPVTLVSARAGHGKTLLLADWARTTGAHDTVWVALGEEDNDGTSLWTAVLRGLAAVVDERTARRLDRLTPVSGPDNAEFLADLIDVLDAHPSRLHLVLDDLQHLVDADVLHGVATVIRHQPDTVRLVLATRVDPALPLARLRGQARLAEVRAPDLRFAAPDAARLLAAAGISLTERQLDLLLTQTDGWAAGLRLAARALRDQPDPDPSRTDLATDQATADYLASEVLDQLPAPTRALLAAVSVCDEVGGSLAAALSGRADAGAVLDDLEREGALVRAAGPDRRFRVQPLLRTHLLAELTRRSPRTAAALHRTAAEWFAEHDEPGKAFDHAAGAGCAATATALLSRYAVRLLLAGAHRTVRRGIVAAGSTTAADPWVRLVSALAHLQNDDPAAAEAELAVAGHGWPAQPGPRLAALRTLVEATLTATRAPAATVPSWRAVVAAQEHTPFESWARAGLGWGLALAGNRRAARSELATAERLASAQGAHYVAAHALTGTGVLSVLDGGYRAAAESCSAARTIAESNGWPATSVSAVGHVLQGLVRLSAADPRAALEHVGRAETEVPALPWLGGLAGVVAGVARFDLGDRPAGLDRARRARAELRGHPPAEVVATVALLEHRCALLLGQDVAARQVLAWARDHLGSAAELSLMRATAAFRHGDLAGARTALAAAEEHVGPPLCPLTGVEARLLAVALHLRSGRRTRARAALDAALALAAPEELIRPFRYAAAEVTTVLVEQIGGFGWLNDVAVRVSRVLTTPAERPDEQTAERVSPTLTGREHAVLALLASPGSLAELATELAVSVNTVKTHVRAIYAKLGVGNRRAAVVAARRLGLT